MDFSPYTPSPDESRASLNAKAKQSKGKSKSSGRSSYSSYQAGINVNTALPPDLERADVTANFNGEGSNQSPFGTVRVNKYETSLPIRVDIEAPIAYVLGPISGLLLLILEQQNDYVRFHAWQSSIVFVSLLSIHFILIFISSFLSWVLFLLDIILWLYLIYRAYLDGATLERYELPYFGLLASEWVDAE